MFLCISELNTCVWEEINFTQLTGQISTWYWSRWSPFHGQSFSTTTMIRYFDSVSQHYQEMWILPDHLEEVHSHNIYRSGYCTNMSMEEVITHALLLYCTEPVMFIFPKLCCDGLNTYVAFVHVIFK